ncbi:putative hydrolase of the HAD superfamily [Fluviicoccus keumensis]|uniref:Putative hydrolase of the HAD superfamily n=1 Tax=Fluviicoccus keumensis TaxID=1435465 RepID=A0A4Q7YJC2_9GAMM|nr:GMP/IMP nucleotidase [Fluviicoccus keumensis]RZU36934.1 putative hydrolase of the HAD superfamily [Fluviicoccus keumensis]
MIDWSLIDTVLLDMDGTLLDLHFDNYFWQEFVPEVWGRQNGHTLAESKQLLYPRLEAERGNLNWYCLDHWSAELGLDIVALKQEIRHLLAIRADADVFLKALADSSKDVWMITNAHPDALRLKLDHTAIAGFFDRILSSHEFGYPKEHPEFWHRLQQTVPFTPARALFIDDSISVLRAARNYGIGHLLTIAQPDSKLPPREGLEFVAVGHFRELLPIPAIRA